jgi:hypothetical protein
LAPLAKNGYGQYLQGHFDALCQRIEACFSNVSEAEGMAEIDAAVALEREQSRLSGDNQH